MYNKLINLFKNKAAATIALLFFVLLGAGTMMAMKAPDANKAKSAKQKITIKHNAKVKARFASQTWYYTPNTAPSGDAIYTEDNYATAPVGTCGGSSSVPCSITFTEGDNYSTLAEYLQYQEDNSLPVNIVTFKDL